MKKIFYIVCILAFFLITKNASAESLTVGDTNSPHNYMTIQQAVDAAQANDYITIMPNTYNEDISVDGKSGLTITGNIYNSNAVSINGKFDIKASDNVTIQYLYLDSISHNYGIKIANDSSLAFKYSTLINSNYGIINNAYLSTYDLKIKKTLTHGIHSKKGSISEIANTIFNGNYIGYYGKHTKKTVITNDTFKSNDYGIKLVNDNKKNSIISSLFKKNTYAIVLNNSKASRTNNTFHNNIINLFKY